MNTTLLKEYTVKEEAGYLGATKYIGSKHERYTPTAELARSIKKALQEVLAPELRKSDVKVSSSRYTGGRSIYITLKLDKSIYGKEEDNRPELFAKRNDDTLSEQGKAIADAARQIIEAFNYDNSNSMVDYFDTDFYGNLRIEWK